MLVTPMLEADKTYNDTVLSSPWYFPLAKGVWDTRENRTLEMERAVFNKIQEQFGTQAKDKNGFPITFADIEADLKVYNAIHEQETEGNPLFVGTDKLQKLNDVLSKYGFGNIPLYNISTACTNRRIYTQGLRAGDYSGVILGTSNGPCPTTRP